MLSRRVVVCLMGREQVVVGRVGVGKGVMRRRVKSESDTWDLLVRERPELRQGEQQEVRSSYPNQRQVSYRVEMIETCGLQGEGRVRLYEPGDEAQVR